MKLINCGIQLLPIGDKQLSYKLIDEAIEQIKNKNFKCIVTPFETIIETSFEESQNIIKELNDFCNSKKIEFVLNIRMHCHWNQDILMDEKTTKFN
jgi:uncharacterized protein YqgV (UPF0045/DUF77 family)